MFSAIRFTKIKINSDLLGTSIYFAVKSNFCYHSPYSDVDLGPTHKRWASFHAGCVCLTTDSVGPLSWDFVRALSSFMFVRFFEDSAITYVCCEN